MTIVEMKEFMEWARGQGATKVSVGATGDVLVEFATTPPHVMITPEVVAAQGVVKPRLTELEQYIEARWGGGRTDE